MHSWDYLEIVKDRRLVGKYCGWKSGQNILLTGDQILITFHSDHNNQARGFLINFTAGPHGKCFSCFIMFIILYRDGDGVSLPH